MYYNVMSGSLFSAGLSMGTTECSVCGHMALYLAFFFNKSQCLCDACNSACLPVYQKVS